MRRLLPAAAALLIAAAPPADPDRLYTEAVAARHAGQAERAIALLQEVIAVQPDNADAHLQLGLALSALHRDAEAEAEFRRTLALAPDYDDARIALARQAERRGDTAGAKALLEPVAADNAEARELHARLGRDSARPGFAWEFNAGASYTAVERGARDWKEGALQLRYQPGATAVQATIETSRRFGATDTYGEILIDHRFSDGVRGYASVGATPDADFRPKWQIGAGGSVRLRSGPGASVLTLDARQARYPVGDIQTLTPGFEQYVAGGRVWLTGRWINTFDENGDHRSGWLGRGDFQASKRLRLFAGIADAPDVSEGVVVDTLSVFGGLSADVGDRTIVRLSVAHDDSDTGSDRTQVSVGLGYRF
ncbi:YaiO family outer membrane beta-barrel protein [Sphingomonas parva]|uniref:YaiO family outer membrane beta-barrel protein n=1 Tax=Sphingomonas parva TaxID=2555898 RepID=A0A4Y8ZWX9_9SPHN|nr:YaiO family outer membrane beta-barrel protein [Sphingomonas parva]TFI59259.1 YaiO family outer membrane beta-barrel protein [Sphingomonas parva]